MRGGGRLTLSLDGKRVMVSLKDDARRVEIDIA